MEQNNKEVKESMVSNEDVNREGVKRVAFGKGYFQNHFFKGKRRTALTGREVRSFLNHRYNADIDKQFRNFSDEGVLGAYLEKEPWIGLLMVSC